MPKRNRSKLREEIKGKLSSFTDPRELLPMPHPNTIAKRRISIREWEEFHQRKTLYQKTDPDYENEFRQPSLSTAQRIWSLLESCSPTIKEHLDSLLRIEHWMTKDEKKKCGQGIKKALVIVLDTFVNAGFDYGSTTYNYVFDALCRKFSDHHRFSLASCVRDMRRETSRRCRRDLLLNGININDLWDLVAKEWSQSGLNPLFDIRKSRYTGEGQHICIFLKDSTFLDQFRQIVDSDRQYTSHPTPGIKALFADAELPERYPRRKVCAEKPYNEVMLGEKSKELLHLQSQSTLLFDVDAFKEDYKAADNRRAMLLDRLKTEAAEKGLNVGHPQQMIADNQDIIEDEREALVGRLERFLKWCQKHREEQFHYQPTTSVDEAAKAVKITKEWQHELRQLLTLYHRVQGHVHEYRLVYRQVKDKDGLIPIHCGFDRIINRRYQSLYFWPTYVSSRNVNLGDEEERATYCSSEEEQGSFRNRWFKARHPVTGKPCDLVGRDVSSSQTQIIVALFGIEELEKLTMGDNGRSFKVLLAEWAWRKHFDPNDDFYLNEGSNIARDYEGPSDQRLQALCKELWMRTSYGGTLQRIIDDQERDPETFGPGWTIENAKRFLRYLYETFPKVKRFLKVCRRIGELAYKKDPYAGVYFTDPSDKVVVRWNPVARVDDEDGNRGHKVILSVPGKAKVVMKAGKSLFNAGNKQTVGQIVTELRRGTIPGELRTMFNNNGLSLSTGASVVQLEISSWLITSDRHIFVIRYQDGTLNIHDGKKKKVPEEFIPNDDGEYPVNSGRLKRMIAPCLIQMLDAYYSTLVMEKLAKRGVTDFVGIHDCWLVLEEVLVDGKIRDGDDVLCTVMNEAAGEWYEGLGSIYEDLLRCLESGQKFASFIQAAKKKWQKRVKQGHKPPVFLAHSSK